MEEATARRLSEQLSSNVSFNPSKSCAAGMGLDVDPSLSVMALPTEEALAVLPLLLLLLLLLLLEIVVSHRFPIVVTFFLLAISE